MPSIFVTKSWESSKDYKTHDIVIYPINNKNKYFYALKDHTSSGGNVPSASSAFWGGQSFSSMTASIKPTFIWRPSYNLTVNSSPRVIVIKFGDGYEQRNVDGINSLLLAIDIGFEGRDSKEAAAILHFFSARNATESFLLTLPHPYDSAKLFVCREWANTLVFYNNYSIRAKIDEVTS